MLKILSQRSFNTNKLRRKKMLKHINNKDFEQEVLKNSKPVLVDFYADWCGPCKMVAPVLEKIGREHTNFEIVKVNVDENQDLAIKYGVMSIPTMIVFKKGEAVDGIVGFSDEQAIINLITKN